MAERAHVSNAKGHLAETPRDIPASGWWSILKRVYASLSSKNISVLAAGVAFYAMLAIFPALAAIVAIYGLVSDPATVQREINAVHGIIPAEAQKLIATYLKSIATSSSSKLSISLIVSLLVALYSAWSGTVALVASLNITYEETEKRGLLRYQIVTVGMTIAAIIAFIIALTLIAAVPAVMQFVPFPPRLKFIGYAITWLILIILTAIGLASLYRFAPSRREAKWRWVSAGGIVATLLWLAVSAGFSLYVARFGDYDKTFGSLGAAVVLLTWLYISAYVVLLGGCLNAEMERQTARDTTRPPDKPMGRRGAKMADTVATDDSSQPASA
jgi:membrane protein